MLFLVIQFLTPFSALAYRAQARKLVESGKKLINMNRLEEAEIKFRESIEEDVTYDKSYYHLARIAFKRKNYKESRLMINKAAKCSPHEKIYKEFIAKLNIQLASIALKDNDVKIALDYYRRNMKLVDFHLPTYNRLAGYQISQGEFKKAEKTCNTGLRKLQSSSKRWKNRELAILHANKSIIYFKLRVYVKAMSEINIAKNKSPKLDIVKKYQKIIFSNKNPIISNLNRANESYDSGNGEDALQYYKKVLKLFPGHQEALKRKNIIEKKYEIEDLLTLAKKQISRKEPFKAQKTLEEVLSIDPENKEVKSLNDKIVRYLEKRQNKLMKFTKKTELTGKAKEESDKKKAEALRDIANRNVQAKSDEQLREDKYGRAQRLENENIDEAIELYIELRDEEPGYKNVEARLGVLYGKKGMIFVSYMDEAYPIYYIYIGLVIFIFIIIWYFVGGQISSVFTLDPGRFYKNALSKMENGKHKGAIKLLEKAMSKSVSPQEISKIKEKRVQCYYSLKNYKKCIELGKEALDLDPRNEKVIILLGESYLNLQITHEEALTIYRKMYKIKKNDSRLLSILSMTYINENNMSNEAVDIYEKVYIRNPGDKTVRKLLCEAYIRGNNRNDGAIRVYEAQLQDEPDRLEIRTIAITALFSKAKYEKVIEHCMFVFRSGVFDEFVLTNLKNSFDRLEKVDDLPKVYEELFKLFPDEKRLSGYMDRAKTNADVARLTGGGSEESMAAGGPKICANCAHINPALSSKCEKCLNNI